MQTAFYRWELLEPGRVAEGPAVVAGAQATAVIPPGFSFRVDESGNVVAVRSGRRASGTRSALTATTTR